MVTSTCALTVGRPGVLGPSADFTSQSSTGTGGVSGTVATPANGAGFKVSAIAPTAFTLSPAGGSGSVSFSTASESSGSTTIGTTPGATETDLNSGLTNVMVNLDAQKSSGAFTAGTYATEVIVSCE